VAAAMHDDAIRAFAIDQAFEQMRQHARKRDATQHVVGSAYDLNISSA
jgi:hypothetical protein